MFVKKKTRCTGRKLVLIDLHNISLLKTFASRLTKLSIESFVQFVLHLNWSGVVNEQIVERNCWRGLLEEKTLF